MPEAYCTHDVEAVDPRAGVPAGLDRVVIPIDRT